MFLPIAALATLPQQKIPRHEPVRAAVNNPRKIDFAPNFVSRLRAPRGCTVTVFASGLKEPRMLLPLSDGTPARGRGSPPVARGPRRA